MQRLPLPGAALFLFCWAAAGQSQPSRITVDGFLQTGFAETFQLTLGGAFGEGPAFQNRGVVNFNNLFRKNDAVSLFGWATFDGPSHRADWQTGVYYRARLLDRPSNLLTGSLGYQHWVFPSVAPGTNDRIAFANLTWQARRKVPLTISADSWRLLSSPLDIGSLLYVQGWTTHTLWSNDHGRVAVRPALASTWSWNFYGKTGHRVFRYGAAAAWETRTWSVEAGLRRQVALVPGIPENRYWSVAVTRTF